VIVEGWISLPIMYHLFIVATLKRAFETYNAHERFMHKKYG